MFLHPGDVDYRIHFFSTISDILILSESYFHVFVVHASSIQLQIFSCFLCNYFVVKVVDFLLVEAVDVDLLFESFARVESLGQINTNISQYADLYCGQRKA